MSRIDLLFVRRSMILMVPRLKFRKAFLPLCFHADGGEHGCFSFGALAQRQPSAFRFSTSPKRESAFASPTVLAWMWKVKFLFYTNFKFKIAFIPRGNLDPSRSSLCCCDKNRSRRRGVFGCVCQSTCIVCLSFFF